MVDQQNKKIETEEHIKQIADRQTGRFTNDLKKLDQTSADL